MTKTDRADGAPTTTDFFGVGSSLTDEELAVQTNVARFVDDRVLPIIGEAFDANRFPAELVPELAKLGLLGCNITGYDCAGMNEVCYGLACQELERGDCGIRTFVSVHGSLGMYPICKLGTEEQRQRWLPAMARGEKIGCFALSESDGGSDPGAMKTSAARDGDDWILDGSKAWITNGTIADIALTWAQTDDGVRGFLVERNMPGYGAVDIEHKYSLRASVTSNLSFDGVRIPKENVLPDVVGLKHPLACLTQARYGIIWGVVGSAIACFTEALQHAQSRLLFGRPLAHTQTIQRRLADMSRKITAAQLMALHLGRCKDKGVLHHSQVSMAKWNNVRTAIEVARDARDMLGADGTTSKSCPIRHMLNLESVITYEGTETIHELIVGRELTGHAAF